MGRRRRRLAGPTRVSEREGVRRAVPPGGGAQPPGDASLRAAGEAPVSGPRAAVRGEGGRARPGPAEGASRHVPEATPARCCPPLAGPAISPGEAASAAGLFKALADPHRVEIVNLLARQGEACVCDVRAAVGLAQPTVSFHLRKLVDAGLLVRERRGIWVYYAVDREALKRLAQVFGEGA